MSAPDEASTSRRSLGPFETRTKRKRIEFVPATQNSTHTQARLTPSISAGERYLSIVFKDSTSAVGKSVIDALTTKSPLLAAANSQKYLKHTLCEICKLPIDNSQDATNATTRSPEASMAHMVCLEDSPPPSNLDRSRPGLKYLSSYGWDLDSRLGLGASGEGIRAPIKAKMKNDTTGLGVRFDEDAKAVEKKVEALDAKQARTRNLEDRRKRERLQQMFDSNDDVAKYLGDAL